MSNRGLTITVTVADDSGNAYTAQARMDRPANTDAGVLALSRAALRVGGAAADRWASGEAVGAVPVELYARDCQRRCRMCQGHTRKACDAGRKDGESRSARCGCGPYTEHYAAAKGSV